MLLLLMHESGTGDLQEVHEKSMPNNANNGKGNYRIEIRYMCVRAIITIIIITIGDLWGETLTLYTQRVGWQVLLYQSNSYGR